MTKSGSAQPAPARVPAREVSPHAASRPACILTVDLDNCSFSRPCNAASPWNEPALKRTLDALDTNGIRATFFVCAGLARGRPAVVREIAGRGHEVACHGLLCPQHQDCTPAKFRCDVAALKRTLENITGARVAGFRASGFSMTRWALPAMVILAEEGFKYDSSIRAVFGPRLPHRPSLIRTGAGSVLELPLTAAAAAASRLARARRPWPVAPLAAFLVSLSWRASKLPAVLPLQLADFGRPSPGTDRLLCSFRFETAGDAASLLIAEPHDVREMDLSRMLPARTRLWRYIHEVESY